MSQEPIRGGSQADYHELVRKLGSHEAAEKHIAARLRELADIVESSEYPKVFGWSDEGAFSPIGSIAITLSYPWGG